MLPRGLVARVEFDDLLKVFPPGVLEGIRIEDDRFFPRASDEWATAMHAPEMDMRNRVLRPVHLAGALVATGVPVLSGALLIGSPRFFAFQDYTLVVMPAVFVANLTNLVLSLGISRARTGPERFRGLLSIGAVLSGICLAAVAVLGDMFASLGG